MPDRASRFISALSLLLVLCFSSGVDVASAQTFSSTNYTVTAPVLFAGGVSSSTSFSLQSVISQMSPGTSTASSFGANAGFLFFPFVSTPVVSATAGNAQVALSWTASTGYLGWTASSYAVGKATASGGPYTFSTVGNIFSSTSASLTNGTPYYFVVRVLDAFNNSIATSTEVSATPTAPASPAPSSGGGGGGGGSITPTGGTVNFSGRAYPLSTVTLLKDAQVVTANFADSKADFKMSVTSLSAGNYIFSVYSEDNAGNRSGMLSFPVSVTAGGVTNIGGIFLAPTINVDKSQVKQGDNLAIFGQSYPGSSVTIAVHSDSALFLRTNTDGAGAYLYNLDSSILDLGSHITQSKSVFVTEISGFGPSVGFMVGNQNVLKAPNVKQEVCIPADLNCDGRVNLVDFSIMAYWYKRSLSGTGIKADLNHDKKVDLIDFSMLMYHWTG